MELRDLFEILGKYCRLIVLTASIFGLGAFVGSTQLPPKYEAVLTLYVKRTAEPAGENFYTYDGYYNQQAAERYTDTVVGLLESGGILQEALRSAGLSADQKAMRRARKSIEVEKVAPQLVEIKVRRRSREEAQSITDSLAAKVIERVRTLNKAGDEALSLEPLNAEPIIERHEPLAALNAVVGVMVGLLVSTLASFFWEYFKG